MSCVLYTDSLLMAQQVSQRSRRWVWWLVAWAAGIALVLYLRTQHSVVEVTAARAEPQTLTQTKQTNARVEPLENFEAHAPVADTVSTIYVQLGQDVQSGQELMRMDDTDARKELATAEASLASSQAALQTAEQGGTATERLSSTADLDAARTQVTQDTASLAALEKLQAQGAASANEVAQAQHRLSAAQARVNELQAQKGVRYSAGDLRAQKALVVQAQAAVEAARAAYAAVDIHAPFAGTVYALPITPYQYVSAGETLVQVANLRKLQITAYFDEPEIGQLKAGQPVSIVWAAKPNEMWHGHVVEVPTTITTYGNTRNVGECLISVDDANGVLLPNTNVIVTVTELRHENVLSLPREALQTQGMNNYVYRIVGDLLVKTPVQVGLSNNEHFEITSGLREGDLVALGATTEVDLSDGLRVKVHH
jgi:HlyD family secretion protein